MKLSKLKPIFAAYSEAISGAGGIAAATRMTSLVQFCSAFPNQTMAALASGSLALSLKPSTADISPPPDLSVEQTVLDLKSLIGLAVTLGVKSEFQRDLELFSEFLQPFRESETLATVLEALRLAMTPPTAEHLVDKFIQRLSRESGTPEFEDTWAELSASSLKQDHMVAIAMSVYGGIKKGTSRKAALAYIRKPHDAYVSAKRGIDATGGRSAA
jgi:hypothetical protein